MRQYLIDSGQLGGLLQIIQQTISILMIVTVVNTSISAYQTFWKYYFSIPILILLVMILIPFSLWIVHAIFLPSLSRYGLRHSYELHNNPLKEDIIELKKEITEIKKLLQDK